MIDYNKEKSEQERLEEIISEQGKEIFKLRKELNCKTTEANYWESEYNKLIDGGLWNYLITRYRYKKLW